MKQLIIIMALLSMPSCMSLETRRSIANEQVQMHPEFGDIRGQLDRLEAKYDTLLQRINSLDEKLVTMEEAHRDNTEIIIEYVRKWKEELLIELNKRK